MLLRNRPRCVPIHAVSLVIMIVAVVLTASPVAQSQISNTQIIVMTGDAAPGDNGVFEIFRDPALNDLGQAAFRADLTNTNDGPFDDTGIFYGDITMLTEVVREGVAVPDGNGSFSSFGTPAINESSQTAFAASLDDTSGGISDNSGTYRGDGVSLTQIARKGQAAPGGNNGVFDSQSTPAINDMGQTGFSAFVDLGDGGSTFDEDGIFYFADTLGLMPVVRKDQSSPDGDGAFTDFSGAAFNNAGQTAFAADLTSTANVEGIYRGDGNTLTQLARTGQTAPDGDGGNDGNFTFFNMPAINDAGQTAFSASLANTSDGFNNDLGIFLSDDALGLRQIVREGEMAPDGNGDFFSLADPALNDAGQVVFTASLKNTTGGATDSLGIFRDDAITDPTQVARAGQMAPDGNGHFTSFTNPAINNAGQVAFIAFLANTSGQPGDDTGLYLFDDTFGLIQVARGGDDLLGSTIVGLGFVGSVGANGDERSGINETGQVAYRFTLADGREGIALFTIPEPASFALLGMISLVMVRRR